MTTTQRAPWAPTWTAPARSNRHIRWWQEVLIAVGVVALVLGGFGVWKLAHSGHSHAYDFGYHLGLENRAAQVFSTANDACSPFTGTPEYQGCLDGFSAR
jgi:hypothetical protein